MNFQEELRRSKRRTMGCFSPLLVFSSGMQLVRRYSLRGFRMAHSRIFNHTYSWVTSLPCLLSLVHWSMILPVALLQFAFVYGLLLARRSMLGTSRRARLLELPLAAAAVRHGVQTVLCNCYPFLEKGSESGNEMMIALHEVSTHPSYQRRHPS